MDEVFEVKDTDLVVKSNSLIASRYSLTLNEQRILLFLISRLEKEDEDFREYKISIASMAKLIGLTDNDKKIYNNFYKKIEQSVRSLMKQVVTIRHEKDWVQFQWVTFAKYIHKEGYIILKMNADLKPYLLELKKNFTAYELGNVIKMKSTYSARIYELLKQYEKIGQRTFEIDEIRKLLQIKEKEYTRVNDFTRYILKPAFEELPKKSDIYFEYEFVQNSKRKYTHITFFIHSQKRTFDDLSEILPLEMEQEFVDTVINISETDNKPELVTKIMDFGISEAQANEFIKTYDEAYILDNLAIAASHAKSKKIDNIGAYTAKALRTDFRKQTNLFEEEQRRKIEEEERLKIEKQTEIDNKKRLGAELHKEWEAQKTREVKAFMNYVESSLDEKQKFTTWLEKEGAFTKNLLDKATTEEAKNKFKLALSSSYYSFLGKSISFEDYAKGNGYFVKDNMGEWMAWK